ncbi:MAG: Rdx family protein [Anaerolineae bacterium]|nr:Rdx family protein [Anaerolineae bacterium]
MAASLAAEIQHRFGLQAELIAGHNGIYEIAVNDKLVYTNQACTHPLVEEEVLAEISRYQPPLSWPSLAQDTTTFKGDAPFCRWSPPA